MTTLKLCSGMSFCHALETKRQEYERSGQYDKIAKLPIVTAFEKESSHGGVWREAKTLRRNEKMNTNDGHGNDDTGSSKPPPMYEGMWCNSAKEGLEYFDYTFDDHFGCALPTYIQRGPILDYISSRVTKKSSEFFDKYVTFNTEVTFVTFDDADQTFNATMKNLLTGEEFFAVYDKVIWAGGLNTKAYVPPSLKPRLEPFKGTLIHSSEVGKLSDSVEGKRILVIGGSYSAEDITLTSIKLGAEKVYITSRKEENVISYTKEWPLNKAVHLQQTTIYGVDENNCVLLDSFDEDYESKKDKLAIAKEWNLTYDEDEFRTCHESFDFGKEGLMKLCDIDLVVLCTGYDSEHYYFTFDTKITLGASIFEDLDGITLPTQWSMDENFVTKYLGEIELDPSYAEHYFASKNTLYYHMIPHHNPNMIYLLPDFIIWADVMAWLALSFVTGENPIPSSEDMIEWVQTRMNDEMQIPALRYKHDAEYRSRIDELYETEELTEEEELEWYMDEQGYDIKVLADMMEKANYPVNIGSFRELNQAGKTYLGFNFNDRDYTVKSQTSMTFRDLGQDKLNHLRSIYSGKKAAKFQTLWMDIDDFDDISNLCLNDTLANNTFSRTFRDL